LEYEEVISSGSSTSGNGDQPLEASISRVENGAMPSCPESSASHGESSASPRPLSPGHLEAVGEVASSRYSAARTLMTIHGVPYLENVADHLGTMAAQARAEVRARERSLERLKERIARMTRKKKK